MPDEGWDSARYSFGKNTRDLETAIAELLETQTALERRHAAEVAELKHKLKTAEKRADAHARDADQLRRAEMRRRVMTRWQRLRAAWREE